MLKNSITKCYRISVTIFQEMLIYQSILCIRNSDTQIGESNFHVYENIFSASIGFMPPDIIASNSVSIIPNATLYYFGVLTSNVHMSWLRTIGGRLKSDYRYTGSIVYNTFPWCNPDEKQKALIESKRKINHIQIEKISPNHTARD